MIRVVLVSFVALVCLGAGTVFAAASCDNPDAARVYSTANPDRVILEMDFAAANQIDTLMYSYGKLPARKTSDDSWVTEGRDILCILEPCGTPEDKAHMRRCRLEVDREGKVYKPSADSVDEQVSKVLATGEADAMLDAPVAELGRGGLNLWVGVGFDAGNKLHDFMTTKSPMGGSPDYLNKGLILTCGRSLKSKEPAMCVFHVNLKGEVSL